MLANLYSNHVLLKCYVMSKRRDLMISIHFSTHIYSSFFHCFLRVVSFTNSFTAMLRTDDLI